MSSSQPSLADLRIERSSESRPPRGAFPWIIVAIVLLGATAVGWCVMRPKVPVVKTVAARELVSGSGERTVLNASGYVTARREATVSSKITGKVTEVLIEEGVKVKDGQILARLVYDFCQKPTHYSLGQHGWG